MISGSFDDADTACLKPLPLKIIKKKGTAPWDIHSSLPRETTSARPVYCHKATQTGSPIRSASQSPARQTTFPTTLLLPKRRKVIAANPLVTIANISRVTKTQTKRDRRRSDSSASDSLQNIAGMGTPASNQTNGTEKQESAEQAERSINMTKEQLTKAVHKILIQDQAFGSEVKQLAQRWWNLGSASGVGHPNAIPRANLFRTSAIRADGNFMVISGDQFFRAVDPGLEEPAFRDLHFRDLNQDPRLDAKRESLLDMWVGLDIARLAAPQIDCERGIDAVFLIDDFEKSAAANLVPVAKCLISAMKSGLDHVALQSLRRLDHKKGLFEFKPLDQRQFSEEVAAICLSGCRGPSTQKSSTGQILKNALDRCRLSFPDSTGTKEDSRNVVFILSNCHHFEAKEVPEDPTIICFISPNWLPRRVTVADCESVGDWALSPAPDADAGDAIEPEFANRLKQMLCQLRSSIRARPAIDLSLEIRAAAGIKVLQFLGRKKRANLRLGEVWTICMKIRFEKGGHWLESMKNIKGFGRCSSEETEPVSLQPLFANEALPVFEAVGGLVRCTVRHWIPVHDGQRKLLCHGFLEHKTGIYLKFPSTTKNSLSPHDRISRRRDVMSPALQENQIPAGLHEPLPPREKLLATMDKADEKDGHCFWTHTLLMETGRKRMEEEGVIQKGWSTNRVENHEEVELDGTMFGTRSSSAGTTIHRPSRLNPTAVGGCADANRQDEVHEDARGSTLSETSLSTSETPSHVSNETAAVDCSKPRSKGGNKKKMNKNKKRH